MFYSIRYCIHALYNCVVQYSLELTVKRNVRHIIDTRISISSLVLGHEQLLIELHLTPARC